MIKKIFENRILKAVLKLFKNMYFLATIVFLVIILFVDTNNVFTLIKTRSDIKSQEEQKIFYKKAIKETEENLLELSSNRDSLEKFAREQYQFREDDEDLYIVVQ